MTWRPRKECVTCTCRDAHYSHDHTTCTRLAYLLKTTMSTPSRCGRRGDSPCARFGRLEGSVRPRRRKSYKTFPGVRDVHLQGCTIDYSHDATRLSASYLLRTTPSRCGHREEGPCTRDLETWSTRAGNKCGETNCRTRAARRSVT
jgi:hypothetical protein